MIEKLKCNIDDSLLQVMSVINMNAKGIAFVTDNDGKLCGIVTDGDIRRIILQGKSLSIKVGTVLAKDYSYAVDGDSYESMLGKMSERVKMIPIVDQDKKLINYFEYHTSAYFPVSTPNLSGNEFKYLFDAFMSTWISSRGEYITRFENSFSAYCDCKFGVATANGTTALHLALMALGIGTGDEVIVPDLTFAATINAVIYTGATPVIVDIEADSWCISPEAIEQAVTPKTKAIIPVHIYGQACNMGAITDIASKHRLKVVEDCAEAHGAKYRGQKVGSCGDVGCFSFFGNKVITTGEGGMCVTNDAETNDRMRLLRDHGMSRTKKYWHDVVGYNYRMTNLQAAIGLAQLERIDHIHQKRKEYERQYREALKGGVMNFQNDIENRDRITWLVSVVLDKNVSRDDFMDKIIKNGVDARPFFYPLSDMDIYKDYCKTFTENTHNVSYHGLNLPTYESMLDIDSIIMRIKEVMA